jgi:hypothetical protein
MPSDNARLSRSVIICSTVASLMIPPSKGTHQVREIELDYVFGNLLLLGLEPMIEVPTFGSSFLLPKLIGALTNTPQNIDRRHITCPTRIKVNNTRAAKEPARNEMADAPVSSKQPLTGGSIACWRVESPAALADARGRLYARWLCTTKFHASGSRPRRAGRRFYEFWAPGNRLLAVALRPSANRVKWAPITCQGESS